MKPKRRQPLVQPLIMPKKSTREFFNSSRKVKKPCVNTPLGQIFGMCLCGGPSPPSPTEDVMDNIIIKDMDNNDIADHDSDSEQSFYTPTEIDAKLINESKSTSTLDSVDNAPNSYPSTKVMAGYRMT